MTHTKVFMITNLAYKFIAATAGVLCNATFKEDDVGSVCQARVAEPRKILVAAMLAYEADTLQIVLSEYDGVADVLISENLNLHNPRQQGGKPFHLWPRIKDRPAFRVKASTIFWRECTNRRTGSAAFEAEDKDKLCESQQIRQLVKEQGYDVVVVGSTDEMLSRRELLRLKWCRDIPRLPTNGAIGMPVGLLGRSFRTDWPPRGMPWAFSMPNVYGREDALRGMATRHLGARRQRAPLVGGLHLTNYCFLPAMILKEMWTSDYGHNLGTLKLKRSLLNIKQKCYDNFHGRTKMSTGAETVVPRLHAACPLEFPAWYGKTDDRELRFFDLLQTKL